MPAACGLRSRCGPQSPLIKLGQPQPRQAVNPKAPNPTDLRSRPKLPAAKRTPTRSRLCCRRTLARGTCAEPWLRPPKRFKHTTASLSHTGTSGSERSERAKQREVPAKSVQQALSPNLTNNKFETLVSLCRMPRRQTLQAIEKFKFQS